MWVQAQIADKQRRALQEKAAAVAAAEEGRQAQALLDAKVAGIVAGTQPRTDFRRRKIDWFN